MKLIAFLTLFVLSVTAEKARFDNYRVHSLFPQNDEQLEALKSLAKSEDYNFWTDVRYANATVDIMVPPHKRSEFQNFVEEHNLKQKIKIDNVQSLIDVEELMQRTRSKGMDWYSYHQLEEVYEWMESLAKRFPNVVKVIVGGKTYAGREIKGIEINYGSNLPGVLLEAGIHAREWVSPAATSWMVNEIVTGSVSSVFKRFNYMYFPFMNPDGYAYTWSSNRLWRKTRTPYKSGSRTCFGADPNRNWDFHWNDVGSSDDPCSETYAGPSAFSEVETKTMSDYFLRVSKAKNQRIFLAYHSYSQLLMYPWGYTTTPSRDDARFEKIARAAAKAWTSLYGTEVEIGSIANVIYETSGTSIEWYYNTFNGTVNFAYELRDQGEFGFLLPPKYIIPSGQEVLASLEAILMEYEKLQ